VCAERRIFGPQTLWYILNIILIEEDTAHAQNDSLGDAREICADGTYFPNNLHIKRQKSDTRVF